MKEKLETLLVRSLPNGSILQQTVKSGAWLGATNVATRGLQLAMLVVLANLLDPADFGVLGVSLLVLSALNKFSKLGLNAAAIQNRDEDVDEYLNTMWVLQLARGALLAGALVWMAPLVGAVFGEPRATVIVRVLALSPLLFAVSNPGVVYFRKNLNYHLNFVYQVSGSVTRVAVSIGWALVSPTVWALVGGLLAADLVRFVASYAIHSYRPWPEFHGAYAAELVDYGKWITGNSILHFLSSEGDDAVVGWLLPSAALGFYQTAYRLSNAPATEISQVIAGVMFPAISTLQDDVAAVREAYYRMLQVTVFTASPVAFGIAAVADVFVLTFMGPKWEPAIVLIRMLAVYGLVRAVGKTTGPVWKAMGRPDYVTKILGLRVVFIALLIVPLTNAYGVEGAALVVTGSILLMFPLNIHLVVRSVDGSYRRCVRELAYPFVASSAMYGAVMAIDRLSSPTAGAFEFCLLVATGVATYITVSGLLAFSSPWDIGNNLRTVVDATA